MGIDEAGRGPLACCPLVVAGVILGKRDYRLNDSKVLSEKKRETLWNEKSKYHIVFKSAKDRWFW